MFIGWTDGIETITTEPPSSRETPAKAISAKQNGAKAVAECT
jgi:hypothetical protein